MAPLCAEFGISRKTGYKIFERYKDCGVAAFTDRSRRPYRQANRLPPQLEAVIVRLKREYPGWGAPKIREKLRRQSSAPHLPAISTVHAVLDRHGLVKRRRRRRCTAAGTALSRPTEPNAGLVRYEPGSYHPRHRHDFAQVWYILEGEFTIGEKQYGPGTMVFHPDPHFEEPLSTETGGLMLFVQYPGPTTGGRPIYDGRFNMKARKPVEEETSTCRGGLA